MNRRSDGGLAGNFAVSGKLILRPLYAPICQADRVKSGQGQTRTVVSKAGSNITPDEDAVVHDSNT